MNLFRPPHELFKRNKPQPPQPRPLHRILDSFNATINELDALTSNNIEAIKKNERTIHELKLHGEALLADANKAAIVAGNLKKLVSH